MADIFAGIDGTTPDKSKARHIMDPFDNAMTSSASCMKAASPMAAERAATGAAQLRQALVAGPDLGGFMVPQCELADRIHPQGRRAPGGNPRITVAGYSRGAYSAYASVRPLGKAGVTVDQLILIDCVKVTLGLTEASIGQIIDQYDDSFDTATGSQTARPAVRQLRREERRPLCPRRRRLYGRRMENEIYPAKQCGTAKGFVERGGQSGGFVVPGNVKHTISMQRDPGVVRDWTNGRVSGGIGWSLSRRYFFLLPTPAWAACRSGRSCRPAKRPPCANKACRLAAQMAEEPDLAAAPSVTSSIRHLNQRSHRAVVVTADRIRSQQADYDPHVSVRWLSDCPDTRVGAQRRLALVAVLLLGSLALADIAAQHCGQQNLRPHRSGVIRHA